MNIKLNNVSRKDEGYKINDLKKLDYKIIQIDFYNGKNFLTITCIFAIIT